MPQAGSVLSFHVEHVVPRQHGGSTALENLALACPHCNWRKGPNLTGIDPDSGKVCRIFDPRRDIWNAHFRRNGAVIAGVTSQGRTTIWVLDLNSSEQLRLRGDAGV